MEGVISITKKGTGYVKIGTSKKEEDIEIDAGRLNTALHGDVVEIRILPKKRQDRRINGEVTKIISRAKVGFAGVLTKRRGATYLEPDDMKIYRDILIPEDALMGAKKGDKVFGEIVFWEHSHKDPEGKIIKVLGEPGNNDVEMEALALERGFAKDLPPETHEEAEGLRKEIKNHEGRKDFRDILTFTIDPEDAKDFDDAISFQEVEGGYEVGIHIADVTHYVKPGSRIDQEAKERGTSVYLVDRTIPMLPEILSNDLCSLVPNQDRLTMSAVFILDKNANIKSEWYGRTVIHSQKRFSYEEAEKTIKDPALPLHKELVSLNNLAKKLTTERFRSGAMSLDQVEVKFVMDENGTPIKVIPKERGDSNRLIEEFMLLANRKVAELIGRNVHTGKDTKNVFVYRVHGRPDQEKMQDLAFFLKNLGHTVTLQNGIIPSHEINSILKKLEGKNEKDTVHRAVIRSMAKAIYSTKNIGHYGLAFKHYTHFTSPIRRYPDMIVHRILSDYLKDKKISVEKLKDFETMARLASEQEKRAADAERASIKYKQVEYMSTRLGEEFQGMISGLTEWGIYVEEMATKCEGMIKVKDLEDDFYIYDERKLELVGKRTKKKYRFGDVVKVRVKDVDLEKKIIDYELV